MSRKPEKADARGGKFMLLPYCLLKSPAWRSASLRARMVLLVLYERHNAYNNGKIYLSARDLADGIGSQNHRANARAIGELVNRGFVELTRSPPLGSRLAREYRLTFIGDENTPATHEYLHWQPDPKPRKFPLNGKIRVEDASTETCVSVDPASTERKLSVDPASTEKKPNDGKPPNFPLASVEHGSTHISTIVPGACPSKKSTGKIANGPFAISAAPPRQELRDRVQAHVDRFGRGSQGRLAAQAKIPAGTFSKFINNGGPLSEQARIRLACSLPRTEETERRGAA